MASPEQNQSARKTIIAASMEDDCFVLATAKVEWFEDGRLHKIAEPIQMEIVERPIEAINLEAPTEDDQGDLESQRTFERIKDYADRQGPVDVIAISSFGTVSAELQTITHVPSDGPDEGKTVKYDAPAFFEALAKYEKTKILVDNDASAAAMGEYIMGAGQGSQAFAYVWAGISVNVGLVFKGELWEGRMHPEMGHCLPRRHYEDYSPQELPGTCFAHKDCIIGLCSYRSIMRRIELGMAVKKVRQIVAYYYAQLCRNIILAVAPDRIVIGGYMRRSPLLLGLVGEIDRQLREMMGKYPSYAPPEGVDGFIQASDLGRNVSVLGMIETARRYLDTSRVAVRGNDHA